MRTMRCVVLLLLFWPSAVSADEQKLHQYDLELSRTLTLEPSGSAPQVTAVTASPTVDSIVKERTGTPNGLPGYLTALLVMAALAAAALAYRRGLTVNAHDSTQRVDQLTKTHQEIATLKEALMESGSGARKEWDSSLRSYRNQIEEKNRRIDTLLDGEKLGSSRIESLQGLIDQHHEELDKLQQSNAEELSHQAGEADKSLEQHQLTFQQQLAKEKASLETVESGHETALKAQAQQFEQQSAADKAALVALESSQEEALEAQAQQFEEQLAEQKNSVAALEASHSQALQSQSDKFAQALATSAAALDAAGAQQSDALKEQASVFELQIAESEAQLLALQAQHNEALQQQEVQSRKEIGRSRKDQDALKEANVAALHHQDLQLQERQTEWNSTLAATEQRHQQALDTLNAKVEQQQKAHEAQLDALKNSQDSDSESRTTDLESQLLEARQQHEKLTQEHELAINALKDAHTAELGPLTEQLQQELENRQLLDSQTSKSTEHLQEMDTAHQNLQAQHQELLTSFDVQNEEHQARIDIIAEEHQTKIDILGKEHQRVLQEQAEKLRASVNQSASEREQVQQQHQQAIEDQAEEFRRELGLSEQQHELVSKQHEETLQNQENFYSGQLEQTQSGIKALEAQAHEAVVKREQEVEMRYQAKLNEIEAISSERKRQMEALEQQYAGQLDALNEKNASLEDAAKKLDKDVQTINSRLSESQQHSESLTTELSELRQSHQSTAAESARLDKEKTELSAKIERSSQQNGVLTEQVEALNREIQELRGGLASGEQVESKLYDATETITDLEAQLNAAKSSSQQLNSRFSENTNELEQARQSVITLEASSAALQHRNKALEEQIESIRSNHSNADTQLEETRSELDARSELLQEREGRIEELEAELAKHATEIQHLRNSEEEFTGTITNLEALLEEGVKEKEMAQAELDQSLDRAQQKITETSKRLDSAAAGRDSLSATLAATQKTADEYKEEIRLKDLRFAKTGAQLVELKTRQEKYLQEIAAMEHRLTQYEQRPAAQVVAPQEDELHESLRTRDDIVAALEYDARDAEEMIRTLQQQVESLEVAAIVQHHAAEPDASPNLDVAELKQTLIEKIRQITLLETDLKVHKDLVRVFESDSAQLQQAEEELEKINDSNTFLQSELAAAVNEVARLKKEFDTASTKANRHKNIGRDVAPAPAHQELIFRLATLETENKKQAAVIRHLEKAPKEH